MKNLDFLSDRFGTAIRMRSKRRDESITWWGSYILYRREEVPNTNFPKQSEQSTSILRACFTSYAPHNYLWFAYFWHRLAMRPWILTTLTIATEKSTPSTPDVTSWSCYRCLQSRPLNDAGRPSVGQWPVPRRHLARTDGISPVFIHVWPTIRGSPQPLDCSIRATDPSLTHTDTHTHIPQPAGTSRLVDRDCSRGVRSWMAHFGPDYRNLYRRRRPGVFTDTLQTFCDVIVPWTRAKFRQVMATPNVLLGRQVLRGEVPRWLKNTMKWSSALTKA